MRSSEIEEQDEERGGQGLFAKSVSRRRFLQLSAMGVAAAWGATIEGELLWPGETPRHLGNLIAGWSLEADAMTQ